MMVFGFLQRKNTLPESYILYLVSFELLVMFALVDLFFDDLQHYFVFVNQFGQKCPCVVQTALLSTETRWQEFTSSLGLPSGI